MRNFLLILFLIITIHGFSQISFNDYFLDKSMRVDFVLAGEADSEYAFLQDIKEEPFWGGTKTNLIDPFDYGEYRFDVIDKSTNKKIYTKGFCTFFEEWQTTAEAKKVKKSFYEVITFPYPKNPVILNIYSRKWEGEFELVLTTDIFPRSYLIGKGLSFNFQTQKHIVNGPADKVLDIAFLAEGYTAEEMDKFKSDVDRMMNELFSTPPYDQFKDKINVWLVNSISEEPGSDIPGENIWKSTIMNSSFYTFDSERYLTSQDYRQIRDIAALVPYDQIYVLVNTKKYGGGGIYNHYNLTSVDHDYSEVVFVHEFGHGFAGLADEYYDGSTSYEDFVNIEIEPWAPNITTLKNFESKWKDMLSEDTEVPTESTKENYNVLGVYEGACYTLKGVYRPFINCRMKTNQAESYCPVCTRSIIRMFEYYCED